MRNPFAHTRFIRKNREVTQVTETTDDSSQEKELAMAIDQLQTEIQGLRKQIQAMNQRSVTRVGLALAVPGVLAMAISIIAESQFLALVGLGLIFWGALFFLVRPVTYVRGSLVGITADTPYVMIDRILNDLKCKGRGLYIPAYPKQAYLPEHLKGLKETIVFISAAIDSVAPSVGEIASGKFLTKEPEGVCLTAPGSSFLDLFEKLLKTDITKSNLEDLSKNLPQIILENFQLAKEIEMKIDDKHVFLRTSDSIYRNLYRAEGPKSARLLGDPLTSAVASAIAKATGMQVSIESLDFSRDSEILEVSFMLKERVRL